jgi:hypothetical protein
LTDFSTMSIGECLAFIDCEGGDVPRIWGNPSSEVKNLAGAEPLPYKQGLKNYKNRDDL